MKKHRELWEPEELPGVPGWAWYITWGIFAAAGILQIISIAMQLK